MDLQSVFTLLKKSNAAYQKYCHKVIQEWGLNATAFQVVMFFANNPERNTARDLCRIQGMKTGIASVAIENLIQHGFLERRTDENDRRIQRLYITDRASGLVDRGNQVQKQFSEQVKSGLTEEEVETYLRITAKMLKRIDEIDKELK